MTLGMPTRTERIDKLRARLTQLEQREKSSERKKRTRRLILWGTLVEERMAKDPDFARSIRKHAARKFTRKVDREALGLSVEGAEDSASSADNARPG